MLIIFLLFYEPSAMSIIFSLKSIKKQLLDLVYGFLHLKCIIKQLLDGVFVICQIINVEVRVISLAFGSADTVTLTSTLIILHITKTSSNNCLFNVTRAKKTFKQRIFFEISCFRVDFMNISIFPPPPHKLTLSSHRTYSGPECKLDRLYITKAYGF